MRNCFSFPFPDGHRAFCILLLVPLLMYGNILSGQSGAENNHISHFQSLAPTGQTKQLILPASHQFQALFWEGDAYTHGGGYALDRNDFAAFLPFPGSDYAGYLSINHEGIPGGVSMLQVHFDDTTRLWTVDRSEGVDFGNRDVGGTEGNCSGGVTPWGTILSAEERYNNVDGNSDGYADLGWLVEVDPATARVMEYGNGKREKLWAAGHLSHENATILADERTMYLGEDGPSGGVYKFIADRPRDLSSGKLYVLRMDEAMATYEPGGTNGRWLEVPNTTVAERNATRELAIDLGATDFDGVEDVEYHPVTGQIYFSAKGAGRVYRFTDTGDGVIDFETFVGGRNYLLTNNEGHYQEDWGTGNDNLTFDNLGNLWVLQDGGKNYIWIVRPEHTQADPDVAIFASMPRGSEPTGLNFTTDNRYGFFSVQHPLDVNELQLDASSEAVRFTRSATLVFSLAGHLGKGNDLVGVENSVLSDLAVFPNPTTGKVWLQTAEGLNTEVLSCDLFDLSGRRLGGAGQLMCTGGIWSLDLKGLVHGDQVLILRVRRGDEVVNRKIYFHGR